jgi:uncharacterized BrkB/YihY/UPF0761 family membrane protein
VKRVVARIVFGVAVALVLIIGIVMVVPVGAEAASAVSGKHIWTLETVQYFVIPVAAFVVAILLLRGARRTLRTWASIVFPVAAVAIVCAASAAPLVLFYRLLFTQYR